METQRAPLYKKEYSQQSLEQAPVFAPTYDLQPCQIQAAIQAREAERQKWLRHSGAIASGSVRVA